LRIKKLNLKIANNKMPETEIKRIYRSKKDKIVAGYVEE